MLSDYAILALLCIMLEELRQHDAEEQHCTPEPIIMAVQQTIDELAKKIYGR